MIATLSVEYPTMSADTPKPDRFKIELPDRERGLSAENILKFDKLKADLANPRSTLSDAQKEERRRQISEIEAQQAEEAEKAWRQQSADETENLAAHRGEDVGPRGVRGQLKIASRDALGQMLETGKLSADQYDAGVKVRDLYEQRGAGLGSQMSGLGAGGGAPTYDNSAPIFYGVQRGKALHQIGTIERTIAIECSHDAPNALKVMRWVCDLGHSVRSLGGGRAYEVHVHALVRALEVADAVIRKR